MPSSYTVKLKPGITDTERRKHIEDVKKLCDQYKSQDKENKFAGIEYELNLVFPGYSGSFHPSVVDAIKKSPVSVKQCTRAFYQRLRS